MSIKNYLFGLANPPPPIELPPKFDLKIKFYINQLFQFKNEKKVYNKSNSKFNFKKRWKTKAKLRKSNQTEKIWKDY